jgi:hypothetical protein
LEATVILHICRYVMYGDITFKASEQLRKPEVLDYFASLIQRVSPKSYKQAEAEVVITRQFLDNFGGDQVRLAPCSERWLVYGHVVI